MKVYKRNSSPNWQIEIRIGDHVHRRSSKTKIKRDAQTMAEQWEKELRAEADLGRVENITLGIAIERYFNTVIKAKNNPGAGRRERYVLDAIKATFGADLPLRMLSAPMLTEYRDKGLAEGKAPATVNRYLAIVRAILNRAHEDWGVLSVVPKFKLLSFHNMRYRFLTDEEEQRLLAASAEHLQNLIIFLLDTGARKTEALTLKWSEVALERYPRPTVSFMKTKNGKPRSVPLTARVEALLRDLKAKCPEGEPHVFLYTPHFAGEPVPFRQPHGGWKNACQRAELHDVVMHDLRHTFASRLVMKGVPLLAVSELLGHSDIKMTQRYAHLSPAAFDDAISALE